MTRCLNNYFSNISLKQASYFDNIFNKNSKKFRSYDFIKIDFDPMRVVYTFRCHEILDKEFARNRVARDAQDRKLRRLLIVARTTVEVKGLRLDGKVCRRCDLQSAAISRLQTRCLLCKSPQA